MQIWLIFLAPIALAFAFMAIFPRTALMAIAVITLVILLGGWRDRDYPSDSISDANARIAACKLAFQGEGYPWNCQDAIVAVRALEKRGWCLDKGGWEKCKRDRSSSAPPAHGSRV